MFHKREQLGIQKAALVSAWKDHRSAHHRNHKAVPYKMACGHWPVTDRAANLRVEHLVRSHVVKISSSALFSTLIQTKLKMKPQSQNMDVKHLNRKTIYGSSARELWCFAINTSRARMLIRIPDNPIIASCHPYIVLPSLCYHEKSPVAG